MSVHPNMAMFAIMARLCRSWTCGFGASAAGAKPEREKNLDPTWPLAGNKLRGVSNFFRNAAHPFLRTHCEPTTKLQKGHGKSKKDFQGHEMGHENSKKRLPRT